MKRSASEPGLTVATQQAFLQVSQSECANLIDGHASLQSSNVLHCSAVDECKGCY